MKSLSSIFARNKPGRYVGLRGSEEDIDEEGLLKSESASSLPTTYSPTASANNDNGDPMQYGYSYQNYISKTMITLNTLFFCLSTFLFTTSLVVGIKVNPMEERNFCLKQTSEPSPILDILDIPLKTWRLNGTFIEQVPPSIYRMPPSPEVDAAWERIETQTPIPITRQDIINQGKDPDDSAKWPESFGFGPDSYIGRIDVFHQIHCLNRLRQHLHFNFDYYFAGERMNQYHELHVSHCLYTLLQNVMCTANVDVYPHFWGDAQRNAIPDFSINHKCRDFDAILEWHNTHAIPLEEFGALRIPEGMEPRIMNHAFKEAFEYFDFEHPDDGNRGTAVGK